MDCSNPECDRRARPARKFCNNCGIDNNIDWEKIEPFIQLQQEGVLLKRVSEFLERL